MHSRGPHAVPIPHFENPSPCRCLLCLLTDPKLYQLLLSGKRPGDGITRSRHNVSIRYYRLVIREQRLVNWQSRTRIQRERRRETGEELVGVSPPGTNRRTVWKYNCRRGRRGSSERITWLFFFLKKRINKDMNYPRLFFPARFIILLFVWGLPFLIYNAYIIRRAARTVVRRLSSEREERGQGKVTSVAEKGGRPITKLVWFCRFFSIRFYLCYCISYLWKTFRRIINHRTTWQDYYTTVECRSNAKSCEWVECDVGEGMLNAEWGSKEHL